MARRVAVSGLGVVSSLGFGWEDFWNGLLAGRVATGPVTSFDARPYGVDRGGEVQGFRAEQHLSVLLPSSVGRATQIAVAAARMALHDAGVDVSPPHPERYAIAFGTTSGDPNENERFNDV